MSLSKVLKTSVAAFALSAFLAPSLPMSSAYAQASKPAVTKKADQKQVKKAAKTDKKVAKKADQKDVKKASAKKTAKKPAAKKTPA